MEISAIACFPSSYGVRHAYVSFGRGTSRSVVVTNAAVVYVHHLPRRPKFQGSETFSSVEWTISMLEDVVRFPEAFDAKGKGRPHHDLQRIGGRQTMLRYLKN